MDSRNHPPSWIVHASLAPLCSRCFCLKCPPSTRPPGETLHRSRPQGSDCMSFATGVSLLFWSLTPLHILRTFILVCITLLLTDLFVITCIIYILTYFSFISMHQSLFLFLCLVYSMRSIDTCIIEFMDIFRGLIKNNN